MAGIGATILDLEVETDEDDSDNVKGAWRLTPALMSHYIGRCMRSNSPVLFWIFYILEPNLVKHPMQMGSKFINKGRRAYR